MTEGQIDTVVCQAYEDLFVTERVDEYQRLRDLYDNARAEALAEATRAIKEKRVTDKLGPLSDLELNYNGGIRAALDIIAAIENKLGSDSGMKLSRRVIKIFKGVLEFLAAIIVLALLLGSPFWGLLIFAQIVGASVK